MTRPKTGMWKRDRSVRNGWALASALLASCASAPPPAASLPTARAVNVTASTATLPKVLPPGPGPRRDLRFPGVVRSQTKQGLEVNSVELGQLPLVQIKLVVRSGSAADPEEMPGLAHLTGAMLREGTLQRSSAQLAEAVDFLGANMQVSNDSDRVVIAIEALAEHFQDALGLVAEIATSPSFNQAELDKLKKRELARLELRTQSPQFLAIREMHKALYAGHPYAHVDTTPAVVRKVKREDLVNWHRQYFAPNNAFLVVTGAVSAEQVDASAERAFGRWAKRLVPAVKSPELAPRTKRDVIIVDRRPSVQSVIYHGNLALPRASPDFIPLLVSNQVLGGSAAGRLFMDLREKRSLTYGAYSAVGERLQVAPFTAYASVRNEVTGDAMAGFEEHLRRIVSEPAEPGELTAAKHYLIDRFPLRIETADKIADLVADLRMYGLPDDYWDHFGQAIDQVTPEQALAAAQKYIRPDQSVIVVVGEATVIKPALEAYGPITVVDINGQLVVKPRNKEH
jgi:zinc protease